MQIKYKEQTGIPYIQDGDLIVESADDAAAMFAAGTIDVEKLKSYCSVLGEALGKFNALAEIQNPTAAFEKALKDALIVTDEEQKKPNVVKFKNALADLLSFSCIDVRHKDSKMTLAFEFKISGFDASDFSRTDNKWKKGSGASKGTGTRAKAKSAIGTGMYECNGTTFFVVAHGAKFTCFDENGVQQKTAKGYMKDVLKIEANSEDKDRYYSFIGTTLLSASKQIAETLTAEQIALLSKNATGKAKEELGKMIQK